MPINTAPPPAQYEVVPDPEGGGIVLQVVYAHHLDGETLAMRLYEAFAYCPEHGERCRTRSPRRA
jgi:nucleotidyltransferase/DNA polymerase involved in DNA repair